MAVNIIQVVRRIELNVATFERHVLPGDVVQGRRRPLHATLAQRLKKAREAAALAREPLSLKAGLSGQTVSNIEQGRIPGIDTVERIAAVLNVSPCYLSFGVEGDAPPLLADGTLRSAGSGARLQQLREHRGLSLRRLGAEAQLSATAIQNIEAARVGPTVASAEQLAKALGCSPCWLAYGEGADPLQEPAHAAAEAAAVKYRPPRKPVAPRRRCVPPKASPRGPY